MLRLRVSLRDDVIERAEPVVGYLHRGAEKLFEVRDYRQITVLANRHDWLSAFSSELGVVLGVEAMLGMELPERAVWARTLLAELGRVLSHLVFLGAFPVEGGSSPVAAEAHAAREGVQAVMEELTGGRMHFMFNRVGGLKDDLPAGWLGRVDDTCADVRRRLAVISEALLADPAVDRAKGVGRLPPSLALDLGVSGPAARASGIDMDLRRDAPYLAYGDLFSPGGPGRVITRSAGDVPARLEVLLEQSAVSLDLVDACVEGMRSLPQGPINQRLPKVLRVPEGDRYTATESPLGENGYYLVSRGDKTPWRLKLRSASFCTVSSLGFVVPGHRVEELVPLLASMCFMIGDADR
ncbi:NADH-quinone oxidoreductase subunit D [Marihabitans asiaticum]